MEKEAEAEGARPTQEGASEGLLACVQALVRTQLTTLGERTTTHAAAVRSLAGVRPEVRLQRLFSREHA